MEFFQEGELSADLYTFHEAVSHLQEMEEDVLDSHKLMLDQLPKWHQSCVTLLAMTNEVDYDVDGIPLFPKITSIGFVNSQ